MTKPLRVLLMVENVALARDHRLRKHAGALVQAGAQVTVICRRDPRNHAVAGVRVLDYPAPTDGSSKLGFVLEYLYSLLMAGGRTAQALLSGGFDVVQISSTPDVYFLLAAPLRLLRRRVVFDFKDLSPEMYAARYGRRDGLMYRLLLRFERASLRTADHVVVVNEAVREVAVRRGGVPATATTLVGNGPRLGDLAVRPVRPELRGGHRYLCCLVGMMGPQDSIDVGIEAVAHLVHTIGRTDCGFTFVGVGDAVDAAREQVARLRLQPWVSFPGWAEAHEVQDYLSTADLGFEPNLEPFVSPVKAMEYMAFGLPFVAFDLPETRRLAAGGAALAPPGDVVALAHLIDGLLADPARRREMGRAGRRAVEQSLAWEHQQRAYLSVFDAPGGADRGDLASDHQISTKGNH
jgi:glycosyltransferase involved in cell wall biosynthesis